MAMDNNSETALADALRYLQRYRPSAALVRMPWHNSPLVCSAMGLRPPSSMFPQPRMPGPHVPPLGVTRPAAPFLPLRSAPLVGQRPVKMGAAWMPVRAGKQRISLAVQARDDELEGALGMWRDLVSDFGDSSDLFVQIAEAESQEEALNSFDSSFYGKPASTLSKRACSLRLYTKWAKARGRAPWPLTEPAAFAYADSLRSEGAPATRLQSWREALGFARVYVGLRGTEEVLGSRRITGSALRCFATKRMQVKRQVLSAKMVMSLEDIVDDEDEDRRDRVFAGFALFCVFGRQRAGDAAKIKNGVKLDLEGTSCDGYVEASMVDHKRAAKVRRKMPLPVVAPTRGVSVRTTPWGVSWARVRAEAQLSEELEDDQPLMQSVLTGGDWSGRALTTDQTAQWLCRLLTRRGFGQEDLERVGSHSLKATALSWMAKAGIQKAHRRLLGGHIKPGDRSMAEYSRDELSEPLRHLEHTIAWIRGRRFNPDATRSGLWSGKACRVPDRPVVAEATDDESDAEDLCRVFPAVGFEPLDEAEPGAGSSDGSAASLSSKSSAASVGDEASDAEVEEDLLAWAPNDDAEFADGLLLPSYPEGGLMRSSTKPFMLHAMRLNEAATLCGVQMSDHYTMIAHWPEVPWPRCRRCFKP